MIYNSFLDLPNGSYFFTNRPHIEEDIIYDTDTIISQQVLVKDGYMYGKNKKTGEKMKKLLNTMETMSDNFIIADTYDNIIKERIKIIHRLKTDLENYYKNVLNNIETVLHKSDYYDNLEKFPEAII